MFVEIVHVKKSNHYPSQDFLIPQLQVIAKTRDQIKKTLAMFIQNNDSMYD